jgi:cytochrome P450
MLMRGFFFIGSPSYSRPEPHKRLKKFLSPAFVTSYVDSMDDVFCECVKELMMQWSYQLTNQVSETETKQNQVLELKVDLMDALHRMALDM